MCCAVRLPLPRAHRCMGAPSPGLSCLHLFRFLVSGGRGEPESGLSLKVPLSYRPQQFHTLSSSPSIPGSPSAPPFGRGLGRVAREPVQWGPCLGTPGVCMGFRCLGVWRRSPQLFLGLMNAFPSRRGTASSCHLQVQRGPLLWGLRVRLVPGPSAALVT